MSEFKVGDLVIYPNQGLGVVEAAGKQHVAGHEVEVYHVLLQETNSRVMIPIDNADTIGLRPPTPPLEVERILTRLRARGQDSAGPVRDWKARFKENTELLKSGKLDDAIQVLHVLTLISRSKPLSFREKRMCDKVRSLVIAEIATVRSCPKEEVEALLNELIGPPPVEIV